MTSIRELINAISITEDCRLLPPDGIPNLQPPHVLPEDVQVFYNNCGGAILYENSIFPVTIVTPGRFVQVNYKMLVGLSPEELESTKDHFSWSWYLVAEYEPLEYVSIDCDPIRLGYCYFSFWDSHAMKGSSPIVARSFTEFLDQALQNEGNEQYWRDPIFQTLGDAYDLLPIDPLRQ